MLDPTRRGLRGVQPLAELPTVRLPMSHADAALAAGHTGCTPGFPAAGTQGTEFLAAEHRTRGHYNGRRKDMPAVADPRPVSDPTSASASTSGMGPGQMRTAASAGRPWILRRSRAARRRKVCFRHLVKRGELVRIACRTSCPRRGCHLPQWLPRTRPLSLEAGDFVVRGRQVAGEHNQLCSRRG